MTLALIIRSVLELAAVVLLIVGLINEKKIIAFETKLFRAIRIHIRNYKKSKALEAAKQQEKIQTRAPADEPETETVVCVVRGTGGASQVA